MYYNIVSYICFFLSLWFLVPCYLFIYINEILTNKLVIVCICLDLLLEGLWLNGIRELLDMGYEEVKPLRFYRDIFPKDSLQKKGILLDNRTLLL